MPEIRTNTPATVDPLQHVNDPTLTVFPRPTTLEYMRVLVNTIRDLARGMIYRDRATPYLLLQSPNGTVFKVSISDTGVVTAVNARGA